MDLNKRLVVALTDEIEKWCSDNTIRVFIGGSRRFGYATEKSDIDFFIYKRERKINFEDKINWKLLSSGFKLISSEDHSSAGYPIGDLYSWNGVVHILVMYAESQFEELKLEHDHLVVFLDDHPLLIGIIADLKNNELNGANVYRHLLQLMRLSEREFLIANRNG